MSKTRRGFGILALVCVLLAEAALVLYRPSPTPPDLDAIRAKAKTYDAQIRRDDFGVPHVWGRRNEDAAFALGYAQAEDDWPTLENVVWATRGRLAEHVGVNGIATDILVRHMDFWSVLASEGTKISPKARAIAQGFADGVNLYLADHTDAAEPGLGLITADDIIAGFMFKTPLFFGLERVFGALYGSTRPDLSPLTRRADLSDDPRFTFSGVASNAIAVAPKRSSDGATRLIVNSHQPWSGPVAWYEAAIRSEEGWHAAGGIFPGAPMILHGHNAHLAWAATVNRPILTDVFVLKTTGDQRGYELDGATRPFAITRQPIKVKVFGRLFLTLPFSFKRSVHGAVIERAHGTYALRWAGMNEVRQIEAYLDLNFAKDVSEFQAALAKQALPSINLTYGDDQGHIGYVYNARFPKRSAAIVPGTYLDGTQSALIATQDLPFAADPMIFDPPSGFLISSNHTPFRVSTPGSTPDPKLAPLEAIGEGQTFMTNRALRGLDLLSAAGPLDDEGLLKIKFDTSYAQGSRARALIAEILAAPPSPDANLTKARDHLATWDFSTDRDNKVAALAILTLYPIVRAELEGKPKIDPQEALGKAAIALLNRYRRLDIPWGEVNRLRRGTVDLPLDGAPDVLRAIEGADPDPSKVYDPKGGDSYLMAVTFHGPGQVRARSIHVYGSATSRPNSPHYADQAPLFAAMKLKDTYFDEASLLAHLERSYRPGEAAKP